MKKENYWFALKSHIYVEFKEENILLYDTRQGNRIESTSGEAIALIRQMYEPVNLGVIPVNDNMLSCPCIGPFVQEVVAKNMGDLTGREKYPQKPVRLLPILNLQKDIDKYKGDEDKLVFFEKDIRKYLLELNVYVNNACGETCRHCNLIYKQVHCCTADGAEKRELSAENLKKLFEQLRYSPLRSVNVLGGNVLDYSHLAELKQLATLHSKELHYYLHYKNYRPQAGAGPVKWELLVTFPVDETLVREVCLSVDKENTRLHYIIESDAYYHQAVTLQEKSGIAAHDFLPLFTGSNLDFFRENIFVDKEDLFGKILSMREIFRNKKLNSNFFGVLYVLPDGSVKANLNAVSVGNIQKDELLNLIQKELILNTAWRQIRDRRPCSGCIYQFICPPVSNYEKAIGKDNLCHLYKV